MTVRHNIPFILQGTYNADIRVACALNVPVGSYIGRDALTDAVHYNGTINNEHPTLAHVIKCRFGICISKGAYKIEQEWNAGDYTLAEVEAYRDLLMTGAPSYFSCDLTFDTHKIAFLFSEQNIELSSWSEWRLAWMLDTPDSKITITSEANMTCFTVLNGNFDTYTHAYKTIEPGASLTVSKSGNTYCFLTFTGRVTKDGTDLDAWKTYNQTSETLSVTNNTSARIRVLKHSR